MSTFEALSLTVQAATLLTVFGLTVVIAVALFAAWRDNR
jgi:hypothetical protein